MKYSLAVILTVTQGFASSVPDGSVLPRWTETLAAVLASRNLGFRPEPDYASIRKYYEEHSGEFLQAQARHILVRFQGSHVPVRPNQPDRTEAEALARARELRQRIIGGEDFAAVARLESDDEGSGKGVAPGGGDLGTFPRGTLMPAFEEAAFSLPIDQVSEPVKTSFGYHIIKVENRYRAGQIEQVRARHILVRFQGSVVPIRPNQPDRTAAEALARAQELRQRIIGGEDFAAVARLESDDEGSAKRDVVAPGKGGGDLGTFPRGQMIPAFDEAAFSLPIDQVSEPVKTPFGYHIIKIEMRSPRPFETVETEVRNKARAAVSDAELVTGKAARTFPKLTGADKCDVVPTRDSQPGGLGYTCTFDLSKGSRSEGSLAYVRLVRLVEGSTKSKVQGEPAVVVNVSGERRNVTLKGVDSIGNFVVNVEQRWDSNPSSHRYAKVTVIGQDSSVPSTPSQGGASIDEIIRSGRYSPMPNAARVGTSGSGPASVKITNDTKHELTLVYDGSVSRSVNIVAGGSQTIQLPPGPFRVFGRVSAPSVLPFIGTETYGPGDSLVVKFYIQ